MIVFPIISIEAENEHFEMVDSVVSWIENYKVNLKGTSNQMEGLEIESKSFIDIAIDELQNTLPHPSARHQLSGPGMAWRLIKIFSERHENYLKDRLYSLLPSLTENVSNLDQAISQLSVDYKSSSSNSQLPSPDILDHVSGSDNTTVSSQANSTKSSVITESQEKNQSSNVLMRGDEEWAPPRAQIIFNIPERTNFKLSMCCQNYRCAGCGIKIDPELARRSVLYCFYFGKHFCKCCYSYKSVHLPCYIIDKWEFHKYPVSHFALQFLDRIANEPLFNINDLNPNLYRKSKKLGHLVEIRTQLYYLKIYISTCTQTDKLKDEYLSFTHQHLMQEDVHLYSLNSLIEIELGKLYEYLKDLSARSIAHIAQCDRCRAKGHYCQLCGPSSLASAQSRPVNMEDYELIFPFELRRVAQCQACGCCYHVQCFIDAGEKCPKCERIRRRVVSKTTR